MKPWISKLMMSSAHWHAIRSPAALLQPGTHAGRKCIASACQPQAAVLSGKILTYRRRCHWRCLTNPWTGKRARVCLIVMHGHWEDAKASSYFFFILRAKRGCCGVIVVGKGNVASIRASARSVFSFRIVLSLKSWISAGLASPNEKVYASNTLSAIGKQLFPVKKENSDD